VKEDMKENIFVAALVSVFIIVFILLVISLSTYYQNKNKCLETCNPFNNRIIDGACYCKSKDGWILKELEGGRG